MVESRLQSWQIFMQYASLQKRPAKLAVGHASDIGYGTSNPACQNVGSNVKAANSKSNPAPQTYRQTAWHMNLQSAILFMMLFTAPILPRINIAFLALLAILSLVDLFVLNRSAATKPMNRVELALPTIACGFVAYLFVNSFWARQVETALGKAALVGLIVGAVITIAGAFARQPEAILQKARNAAIWGALLGLLIALFEYASGHFLRVSLYEIWPSIRSESNAMTILIEKDGALSPLPSSEYSKAHENEVIMVHTDGLNRNLSLVLLYLWAMLAMAWNAFEKKTRLIFIAALFATAAASILFSASQTAQFALAGGLAIFTAARILPKIAHWTLVACWCVALIFTLPIASAPYNAGLHKADWLFPSARDRIAIWSLTSELARQSPILGVGIRSPRYIGREMRESPEHAASYAKPRRLGIHAHNHFLQIWFELGAVGATFVLALGLGLLARIRRLTGSVQPYAYATFGTAALIAAFGWGLWQTWLLAGFGAAIVLFQLAVHRETD